jgi:hypothetical protein
MEIIYHITKKDILAARCFMRKVSRVVKRHDKAALILIALIPCFNFLLRGQFTMLRISQMLVEILIIALVYISLTAIFNPLFDRLAVSALKQEGNGVLGEHKICLTEEILIESTSVNESHQKWTGIEGVYENENYILIMVGNQHGHIIPKRAFVSSDAAKQFYNQARSYQEKSQES